MSYLNAYCYGFLFGSGVVCGLCFVLWGIASIKKAESGLWPWQEDSQKEEEKGNEKR